ncbi:MAG: helix-turn-helix domain-containing protein [Flavobacteriaceae bacterium]
MNVKIYKPIDPNLVKLVDYYYFLYQSGNENSNYFCFPNLTTYMFSFVKNVNPSIHKQKAIFKSHSKETISPYLITPFTKPMNIQYEGEIFELNVSFKPLGINHFINKNLDAYKKGQFNYFVPDTNFLEDLDTLFKIKDETPMIEGLEKFLLSRIQRFEHPFLQKAIDHLTKDISVPFSELSNSLNISQKTLIKHFSTHLNLRPSEYKRILRFRLALDKNSENEITESLTEISNQADFFDQAHMIREFRSLSNHSPKKLLKMITFLEKGKLKWLFQ